SLSEGHIVGMFPEGFVSRDGRLRRFQPGISKIVRTHQVPVIPVAVSGLWGSIFSYEGGRVIFKFPKSLRRHVKIVVGKPIAPEQFDLKELETWITKKVEDYHHQFDQKVEV